MYKLITTLVHIEGDEIRCDEYVKQCDNYEEVETNYKHINYFINKRCLMGNVMVVDENTNEVLSL